MAGPQQYCTGACHIFVGQAGTLSANQDANTIQNGPAGSSTPKYFGTAEQRPRIEIRPEFSSVYDNDFGSVARDSLYEGQDAIVAADLNYWDEEVFALMSSRVPRQGNETVRGVDWGDLAVGTMMVAEGMSFQLFLQFPNGGAPVGGNSRKFAKMPNGYRFFAAFLLGPDRIEPGTMPEKIRVIWHCQRIKDSLTGDLKLYDHDMSSVPALVEPFLGAPAKPPTPPPPEPNPVMFQLGAPPIPFFAVSEEESEAAKNLAFIRELIGK